MLGELEELDEEGSEVELLDVEDAPVLAGPDSPEDEDEPLVPAESDPIAEVDELESDPSCDDWAEVDEAEGEASEPPVTADSTAAASLAGAEGPEAESTESVSVESSQPSESESPPEEAVVALTRKNAGALCGQLRLLRFTVELESGALSGEAPGEALSPAEESLEDLTSVEEPVG